MGTPELKSEYLKMVPDFSGEPELLPRFIQICEKLVQKFYNKVDVNDFQNDYLMDSIMSKIKGEAQQNLSSCVISNWTELKTALLTTYADKRDVQTLVIEMCSLRQYSESAFEFHNKIQKMTNLQTSYISSHNMDGADHIKKFVLDLGLRTFLRGLKEPLGSLMRTKNPSSLNDALNVLTNDFQIDTTKKFIQGQHQTQRYTPPPFKAQNNNNSKPGSSWNNQPRHQNHNFGQTNSNFGQNNNNFGQNNNPGPNNSNNNNWRNNPTTQFQQNKPQSNVWNRTNNQPLPKPTPMSITTRNTRTSLHNIESGENSHNPQQYEPEHPSQIMEDTEYTPQDFQEQPNGNDHQLEDPGSQNFWLGASDMEHY